jgi:NAD(P)-dependent dehydrogenase (short-subunit alcohol dehydrogenase family)
MKDIILTGASRGIGRALALELAKTTKDRLLLVARDSKKLLTLADDISAKGGSALAVPGDLSSLTAAKQLGETLSEITTPGATLVHNAGLWPTTKILSPEGLEQAFVVNHLAPLVMQRPLLEKKLLNRIVVVSAGLLVKGRFDPEKTPYGKDFSRFRTYCTTKLCFALYMRDLSAEHPEIDVLVLHPGVVRTELGASKGPLGWLLSQAKRSWESPELCAARLARILTKEKWSQPGKASWMFEEQEQPWPEITDSLATRNALQEVTNKLLSSGLA